MNKFENLIEIITNILITLLKNYSTINTLNILQRERLTAALLSIIGIIKSAKIEDEIKACINKHKRMIDTNTNQPVDIEIVWKQIDAIYETAIQQMLEQH